MPDIWITVGLLWVAFGLIQEAAYYPPERPGPGLGIAFAGVGVVIMALIV